MEEYGRKEVADDLSVVDYDFDQAECPEKHEAYNRVRALLRANGGLNEKE